MAATLDSVANVLAETFPGVQVLTRAPDHWDEDTILKCSSEILSVNLLLPASNQIEVVVRPEGLVATWYADKALQNNDRTMNVRVSKDVQLIEEDVDAIGWSSFVRTKLTEQALDDLLEPLSCQSFLLPKHCVPGAPAIQAMNFLVGTCYMHPSTVAHFFRKRAIGTRNLLSAWRQTKGSNWCLEVHRLDRLAGAVAVGPSKSTGEPMIRIKIKLGSLNPLLQGIKHAAFDIDYRSPVVHHADNWTLDRIQAEHCLIAEGLRVLTDVTKAYQTIRHKISRKAS